MIIEADYLIEKDGIRENVSIKVKGKGSSYVKTIVAPGYADAHAHPHVVDIGENRRKWRNSWEWLRERNLRVDERALRQDIDLCTKLTLATLYKSLLEGTTLVALVGNIYANLKGIKISVTRPRIVLTPTILNRDGWIDPITTIEMATTLADKYSDGDVKVGLFVHSLYFTLPEFIKSSYWIACENNIPFAMHLSEGRRELSEFEKIVGENHNGVIGVHCIEDEEYSANNVKVVHCPYSNLLLYGRTLNKIDEIAALGTDWPLLNGGMPEQHSLAVRIHGSSFREAIFYKAHFGGYEIYNMSLSGDYVGFDYEPERVFEGGVLPRIVIVNNKVSVYEKSIINLEYNYNDILKLTKSLIKECLEKYPARNHTNGEGNRY